MFIFLVARGSQITCSKRNLALLIKELRASKVLTIGVDTLRFVTCKFVSFARRKKGFCIIFCSHGPLTPLRPYQILYFCRRSFEICRLSFARNRHGLWHLLFSFKRTCPSLSLSVSPNPFHLKGEGVPHAID